MISIDINLDPFGIAERREGLATIAIWNDGTGNFVTGNYCWAVSHQHDSAFGARAAKKSGIARPTAHDLTQPGPWVWKSGRVPNFRRQRGAVALLAAALKAARV